ncbi:MAG: M17 family peptidase N-terminal domain-containing protein, partial [Pelodictyon phaeoclathratiforme]
MKLSVTKSDLASLECEFLALPFSSGELKKEAGERLSALGIDQQVLKDFKGDAGELVVVYGEAEKCSAVRIALLGLGEKVTLDDWRKAAVSFASRAVDMKIGKIAVDCS